MPHHHRVCRLWNAINSLISTNKVTFLCIPRRKKHSETNTNSSTHTCIWSKLFRHSGKSWREKWKKEWVKEKERGREKNMWKHLTEPILISSHHTTSHTRYTKLNAGYRHSIGSSKNHFHSVKFSCFRAFYIHTHIHSRSHTLCFQSLFHSSVWKFIFICNSNFETTFTLLRLP